VYGKGDRRGMYSNCSGFAVLKYYFSISFCIGLIFQERKITVWLEEGDDGYGWKMEGEMEVPVFHMKTGSN